jgi:carboxymethylenebutenolidase
MCFEPDSLPPIPAIAGAAVSHEHLVLEAADGNRFAAFEAVPDAPTGAGVVVLPDVRGLFSFYEELALRFAERGIRAVAIDYFGRTAGVGERPADWDAMAHARQATREGVQADIAGAVARLRSPARGACRAVFTVGFCFGGANAWMAAASGQGLAGAIGFYGRPGPGLDGRPGPREHVRQMRGTPILALMGGADQGIAAADVAAFEAALAAAGVEHEVVTYEGAPHSFFDRKQEQFAQASEDAWRRTLDFIGRHG